MKRYEVWAEGYQCTGESGGAHLMGTAEAASFKEACDIVCKDHSSYNPEQLTDWGCRLYPTEAEARRSFG